ncbi:glycoside hydrolase superfamily [Mycena rebaudengoi]|nr:glycoside hydrolase superfamily [Mycena rebaudengoi]
MLAFSALPLEAGDSPTETLPYARISSSPFPLIEQDIAAIAGARLSWVRVPIPFCTISTSSAPSAGRKYGILLNLDLHTTPGSQNVPPGYTHSGKLGQINFLDGVMGDANAQRVPDYIRVIVEFILQPEYKDLIPMFGIVNEGACLQARDSNTYPPVTAYLPDIGRDVLTSFYLQTHNMIRGIAGYGAGTTSWVGFLLGSNRIILHTQPYFAFDGAPNDSPIATSTDPLEAGGIWPKQACSSWEPSLNTRCPERVGSDSRGEFSNGYNDCGLYFTGVNGTQHYGESLCLLL